MNAVAMFLQQMQLPVKQEEPIKSLEDDEKHALFQSFLAGSMTEGMLHNEQESNENKEGAMLLPFPLKIIAEDDGNKEMIHILDPALMNKMLTTKVSEGAEQPELQRNVSHAVSNPEDVEQTELMAAYQAHINIFQEVQEILTKLNRDPANMEKAAPKLLQLLQQWVKAANPAAQKGLETAFTSIRQGETKEHMIWKDLVQAFEKRHQLASKQQYSTNALVATEDITKWLSKAMKQALNPERIAVERMHTPSSLPISRIAQYVVYVNQGQSLQTQGQQLTDQFQTILKSSEFLAAPNSGNQLILSLKPENLGEMMIRFTQVNGEMTVKILVTTQAAKEMLETNMHQLRNMFSPQQVVVEKQDTLMQQGQNTEKSMKDDLLDEQKHQESNDSSEEENEQSEDDFAAKFEALLMNEEV
ncbi:flagellar hook-length control protein FliK [Virgibacillus oceani]